MSKFTNLTLGTNWGQYEWPTHVFVSHDRFWESEFRLSVKYVPERTCKLEEPDDRAPMTLLHCSACGMKTAVAYYCSWCGAKVTGD